MAANSTFKKALNSAEKAFKRLHADGKYNPKEVTQIKEYKQLIDETANIFNGALSDNDIPAPMLDKLKNDVFIFSGLKTNAQLLEASKLLLTDEGKVKSFAIFSKDTANLKKDYNQNYLEAEYEFAITSSQMAGKWASVSKDYNLQYRTAGDDRVRESHAALDGITLPADDAFWLSYYPPNGWRCRCNSIEVRKGKYTESNSDKAIEAGEKATSQIGADGKNKLAIFRFNPGAKQVVFPPEHPYHKVKGAEVVKKAIKANEKPYQVDDKAQQRLKELGFSIVGNDQAFFNKNFKGFNIEQLNEDMINATKGVNLEITNKFIMFQSDKVVINFSNPSKGFTITRNLELDKKRKTIEHSLFTLDNKMQGKGISKELFKVWYNQYQNAGIEKVKVHANIDVGGYAWAKYGFAASDSYYVDRVAKKADYMAEEGMISKTEHEHFTGVYKSFFKDNKEKEGFPMYDIARTGYGKKLLLGTDWYGEVDLKNNLQKDMFESYLFGK
ncbi:phage head morphogenesis protein [Flavobacterium cerinum]|uniref:Phage head morphogenesis domain-containing protein n=1 Tax=Flavobacterium cerinum TaxID=2502784 RepID=A0A444HBR2_9FLAO|nr:phage minor head protein [Flavobacterium cerinum]RWX00928.1 hypothetical protein EPI11_07860 [Flavobacterium cerinum]